MALNMPCGCSVRGIAYQSTDWLLRIDDAAIAEDLLADVLIFTFGTTPPPSMVTSATTGLLAIGRPKAISARRSKPDVKRGGPIRRPRDWATKEQSSRSAASSFGSAITGSRRSHRPRLLSRQTDQGVTKIVGLNEATVKQRMLNARKQLAELVGLRTYALSLPPLPAPDEAAWWKEAGIDPRACSQS